MGCGAPSPPPAKRQGETLEVRDSSIFEFTANTVYSNGKVSYLLNNVKITLKQEEVILGPVKFKIISYVNRKVIDNNRALWTMKGYIMNFPEYYNATDRLVTISISKKGDEVEYISFNEQMYTSKMYYSSLARINQTSPVQADTSMYHKVLYGENLGRISKKYGKTIPELKELNPGLKQNIQPGQRIKVK